MSNGFSPLGNFYSEVGQHYGHSRPQRWCLTERWSSSDNWIELSQIDDGDNADSFDFEQIANITFPLDVARQIAETILATIKPPLTAVDAITAVAEVTLDRE
jgi:hypothetical protein